MTELLPCPFCQSLQLSKVTDDGLAWVKCRSCGATGPETTKRSDDNSPDWNTRAQPAGVGELVNALNELIGKSKGVYSYRGMEITPWDQTPVVAALSNLKAKGGEHA